MEYYTSEEIVKDKFLFLSYCSADREIVEADVQSLIQNGIRIWYDRDIHLGDNWDERVKKIVFHPNCVGTIFYSSTNAFLSEPISREREWIFGIADERKAKNEKYLCFSVNIGASSTMEILKDLFVNLPSDPGIMSKVFPMKFLIGIVNLFGESKVYCYADQSRRDEYINKIIEAIKSDFSCVIDDFSVRMRELDGYTNAERKGNVRLIVFGSYKDNVNFSIPVSLFDHQGVCVYNGNRYFVEKYNVYDTEPLKWKCLYSVDKKMILISEAPVEYMHGGKELRAWLDNEFINMAFTQEEKQYIKTVRLLTEADLEKTEDAENVLKLDDAEAKPCWIDAFNYTGFQKVLRTNGEVYNYGYKSGAYAAGVRPVIEIDSENLEKILY